jgi:hypothetical protein
VEGVDEPGIGIIERIVTTRGWADPDVLAFPALA